MQKNPLTSPELSDKMHAELPAHAGGSVAFLGVERSANGSKWCLRLDETQSASAAQMSQITGAAEPLTRVLAGRGIASGEITQYLNPRLRELLPEPFLLRDMEKAVCLTATALRDNRKIAIIGDYDVDGATSTAQLVRYFRALGMDVSFHIPDRHKEGYGPSESAVRKFLKAGVNLLFCADCGSAAPAPLAQAKQGGMDVIILDHHPISGVPSGADALVNPNQPGDMSGQQHLAAAGVVFLFLVALNRALRAQDFFKSRSQLDLYQLLDLVALGTICDVVPLTGVNRAFVTRGLHIMGQGANPGLQALCDIAGLEGAVQAHHLAFMLGPRINAAGRIDRSTYGTELLISDNPSETAQIAKKLDDCNQRRREMERTMVNRAEIISAEIIEKQPDQPVLILGSEEFHPGLVGIVAGRIKERFHRPSLILAYQDDGIAVGSGRSIEGIDLGKAIASAADSGLLLSGGGHAMAVGVRLLKARQQELESFLAEKLAVAVERAAGERVLMVDGLLQNASYDLAANLAKAGPFGAGNPEPVFVLPGMGVRAVGKVGEDHLRLTLSNLEGGRIEAMAFRASNSRLGQFINKHRMDKLHFACLIGMNHYRGGRKLQLKIIDAAPAHGF